MNNEWLARLKEKIGKKENKEELPVRKKLLLLFLTGLLLLVIVLPFPKKSDSEDAETGTETTTENRGSYERYLEQKTEEALQCGGGGECKSDDHAEVFGRKCGRKRSAE